MRLDSTTSRSTTISGSARLATFATSERAAMPVVFLHAGIADSRMWQREFDALSARHRCVAFDRRGFGSTPPAHEHYDSVADTIAVMDAADVKRAVLVGCSNGGRIALDAALAHPDRVAGLVLICAGVGGAPESDLWQTNPTMAALYGRWQKAEAQKDRAELLRVATHVWLDGPLERDGRVGQPVRALFTAMADTALATGEEDTMATFPDNAYAALATLRMPTLIVWGALDVPDVTTTMKHAAATIQGARSLDIGDAAHFPNLERPDVFVPALRRFIEGVR